MFFSRRIVRSRREETQLVVVELLRGGQRHRGSPQADGLRGARVHPRVRPDVVREVVRLDSERDQSETVVHQSHIVSENQTENTASHFRDCEKQYYCLSTPGDRQPF